MFVASTVADEFSFSHLLGLGLPAGRRRRDVLELEFPHGAEAAIEAAASSMRLLGAAPPTRHPAPRGIRLACRSPDWPAVLPQLGCEPLGRRVQLEPWQEDIVVREPAAFLRGLLSAAVRRRLNRFTTTLPSGREGHYEYPRYTLSSSAPELLALFCSACHRVGVGWTQGRPTTISVTHRRSVAILDAIGEP